MSASQPLRAPPAGERNERMASSCCCCCCCQRYSYRGARKGSPSQVLSVEDKRASGLAADVALAWTNFQPVLRGFVLAADSAPPANPPSLHQACQTGRSAEGDGGCRSEQTSSRQPILVESVGCNWTLGRPRRKRRRRWALQWTTLAPINAPTGGAQTPRGLLS